MMNQKSAKVNWFLGVENHRNLEPTISPTKTQFLKMMEILLDFWSQLLAKNGACILVLGAVRGVLPKNCASLN